jgi:hypothetical protein
LQTLIHLSNRLIHVLADCLAVKYKGFINKIKLTYHLQCSVPILAETLIEIMCCVLWHVSWWKYLHNIYKSNTLFVLQHSLRIWMAWVNCKANFNKKYIRRVFNCEWAIYVILKWVGLLTIFPLLFLSFHLLHAPPFFHCPCVPSNFWFGASKVPCYVAGLCRRGWWVTFSERRHVCWSLFSFL